MPKYVKCDARSADEQVRLDAFLAAAKRRGLSGADAMRQAMDLWVAADAETVKRLHELPESGKIDRALGLLAELKQQMGQLTDTVLSNMDSAPDDGGYDNSYHGPPLGHEIIETAIGGPNAGRIERRKLTLNGYVTTHVREGDEWKPVEQGDENG